MREVFSERGAGTLSTTVAARAATSDGPLLWLTARAASNQLTNLTLLQPNTVASTVAGRRGRLRPRESRNLNAESMPKTVRPAQEFFSPLFLLEKGTALEENGGAFESWGRRRGVCRERVPSGG